MLRWVGNSFQMKCQFQLVKKGSKKLLLRPQLVVNSRLQSQISQASGFLPKLREVSKRTPKRLIEKQLKDLKKAVSAISRMSQLKHPQAGWHSISKIISECTKEIPLITKTVIWFLSVDFDVNALITDIILKDFTVCHFYFPFDFVVLFLNLLSFSELCRK